MNRDGALHKKQSSANTQVWAGASNVSKNQSLPRAFIVNKLKSEETITGTRQCKQQSVVPLYRSQHPRCCRRLEQSSRLDVRKVS